MTTVTADSAPPDTAAAADPHPNQFALLKQRRFAPFFWTQFAGAANDNLFKFAFTAMVTGNVAGGLMGSFFSRVEEGNAMVRPFRRGVFSRVGLNVGDPVPADRAEPEGLRGRVAARLAQGA